MRPEPLLTLAFGSPQFPFPVRNLHLPLGDAGEPDRVVAGNAVDLGDVLLGDFRQ